MLHSFQNTRSSRPFSQVCLETRTSSDQPVFAIAKARVAFDAIQQSHELLRYNQSEVVACACEDARQLVAVAHNLLYRVKTELEIGIRGTHTGLHSIAEFDCSDIVVHGTPVDTHTRRYQLSIF